MKNMHQRLLLAFLFVTLGMLPAALGQTTDSTPPSFVAASGSVPRLMQFSSIAKDTNGKPLTGTIGITFLLYQSEEGGAPLWMETQNVQADAKGHYSVQLGATKADGLPADEFNSAEARWLGVQIADEAEQPRVLLLAVPYALKAADASTIGGLPPSAFVRANPDSMAGGTSSAASSSGRASGAGGNGPLGPQTLLAVKTNSPGNTIGFLPIWSGSKSPTNQIASSNLFQSGSNVGLGTTTPAALLDVNGTGGIRDTLTLFPKGSDAALAVQGTPFTVSSTGDLFGHFGSFLGNTSGIVFSVANQNSSGFALSGVNENTSGNGAGVEGSGPNGVVGNGAGTGVLGSGTIGVAGTGSTASNGIGVEGSGNTGVLGTATTSGGIGVFGQGGATGVLAQGQFIGLEGQALGTSGLNFGLLGTALSPTGLGALSVGLKASNTSSGIIGCCTIGAWGDTGSNTAGAAGLVGTADDARAIYLQNNSPSGVPTAYMFQGASGKLALVAGGASGACVVDTNGNLGCHGSKSAYVEVDNGQRQVALYAVEAPQNWFEDFGSGRLANGAASVKLDPTFAQTVNTGLEYHVFLTPEGDCRGLYINNKSASGFEVHELGAGQSNVAFDYRIVALRKGYESVRLDDMTERMKQALRPMPLAPPGPRPAFPDRRIPSANGRKDAVPVAVSAIAK